MPIVYLPILLIFLDTAVNGGLSQTVCNTNDCKTMSKMIKDSMDESVLPCQDFYKFACGNYLKTAKIEKYQSYSSRFVEQNVQVHIQLKSILEDVEKESNQEPYIQMKHLYTLCMDEGALEKQNISPLKNKIKEAGGWPVLGEWDKENFDILKTESTLYNLGLNTNSLFDWSVDIDDMNSKRRILKLDQPELLVGWSYLTNHHNSEENKLLQEEEDFMIHVAVALGANEETARSEMKEVMEFMKKIAQMMQDRSGDIRDDDMYRIVKLNELQKEANVINWHDLLKKLLPEPIALKDDEEIDVTDFDYIKRLGDLIKQFDKKVIANYMIWYAIRDYTDAFTKDLRKLYYEREGTTERYSLMPRWLICVKDVYSRLPFAVSSLFVKKYFNKESKKTVEGYINSMRSFINEHKDKNLSWLSEKLREDVIKSFNEIKEYVGYPEDLIDDVKLKKHYEGLNLDKETYFESQLAWQKWFKTMEFGALRTPNNPEDWTLHAKVADTSEYYDYSDNSINFSAGFLQLPVFSNQVPMNVNLAMIGQIVANELTYSIMFKGHEHIKHADEETEWDEKSTKSLETKKECFAEQYNQFTCSQTNKKVDGTKTLEMNMAVNGGLTLAFEVFKKIKHQNKEEKLPDLQTFTPEQLFWISAANLWCTKASDDILTDWIDNDSYAPPEFRVNGVLKNSEGFREAFNCKATDKMYSEKKCTIWS